jgi:2-polyprenyl-3-methyl-5-hydroxy-6-metoxy-1,4-benzoquinol methylase
MDSSVKNYQQLLETVVCNLCGADDYAVVYPAQYHEATSEDFTQTFRSSGDDILVDQLVRCRRCGLQYLNPRLNQDLILNGYSEGSDETFVSQAAAREQTFARCLKMIERVVPQKGKILDVGTAGGSFLKAAQRNGWEVAGCEPNRWLTEWAKKHYGLTIHAGTIFDMPLKDASFDVLTLWDVLEHTPDPKKVLLECRRVLKPEGLLVVNYPDIGSLIARMMGRKWVFLLSIHLYYFTIQTIREMLKESGFQVLRSQPHWQSLEIDYIFYRIKPYIPWLSDLGRKTVQGLKMQKAAVPYWMGQTLVLARRGARE